MNAASASQTGQPTTPDRTPGAGLSRTSPWAGSIPGAAGARSYDSSIDRDYEEMLRAAAMSWLDERIGTGQGVLSFDELSRFSFKGQRVPLMDPQRGIRKPAQMTAALSIRTSFTPPGQAPPYEDAEAPDGLLRYKYRG